MDTTDGRTPISRDRPRKRQLDNEHYERNKTSIKDKRRRNYVKKKGEVYARQRVCVCVFFYFSGFFVFVYCASVQFCSRHCMKYGSNAARGQPNNDTRNHNQPARKGQAFVLTFHFASFLL